MSFKKKMALGLCLLMLGAFSMTAMAGSIETKSGTVGGVSITGKVQVSSDFKSWAQTTTNDGYSTVTVQLDPYVISATSTGAYNMGPFNAQGRGSAYREYNVSSGFTMYRARGTFGVLNASGALTTQAWK